MKKQLLLLAATIFLSAGMFGQEKAEVSVKIIKDGKIVTDTTYSYENLEQAEHALKMMELMTSKGEHEMHMKHMAMDDAHKKHMKFISENGEVHEFHGDDMTWVSSSMSEDGDSSKIYKVIVKGDSDSKGNAYFFSDENDMDEKVIVNEEDGRVEVIIKKIPKGEDAESYQVRKKIIILDDDEDNELEWTMEKDDDKVMIINENGKIIKVIKEIESDDEGITWSSKEGDLDEDVEVIIINKKEIEEAEKMQVKVDIKDNESDVKSKIGKKKSKK